MDQCIFCKIVTGEIPSCKVFEDERVLAFADINPITNGHTLIIPKTHAENIWEISETDLGAIHKASKKVADGIKTALQPDGMACLQLNGRAVNQLVMHYHLHLIPKTSAEPELTMTAWELKPGDMLLIESTAKKIAEAIR